MLGLSQEKPSTFTDVRPGRQQRDDGRVRNEGEAAAMAPRKYFRKEFGWVMNDDEVKAWKDFKVKSTEAADKYKKDYVDPARQQYNSALNTGRSKIDSAASQAVGKIPKWQEPSYTRIRLAGDGDPGQDYMVVNDNVGAFLGAYKNDYYKIVPQSDGSYHVHLKEYGKEGYETANDYMRKQDQMLNAARENYNREYRALRGQIDSRRQEAYGQLEGQLEAQAGPGLRTLESNHQRLVNQYKDKVKETKEIAARKRELLNKSILEFDNSKIAQRRGLSEEI